MEETNSRFLALSLGSKNCFFLKMENHHSRLFIRKKREIQAFWTVGEGPFWTWNWGLEAKPHPLRVPFVRKGMTFRDYNFEVINFDGF